MFRERRDQTKGSGPSIISCGCALRDYSTDDVIICEARDRIGGRVVVYENDINLGAPWSEQASNVHLRIRAYCETRDGSMIRCSDDLIAQAHNIVKEWMRIDMELKSSDEDIPIWDGIEPLCSEFVMIPVIQLLMELEI